MDGANAPPQQKTQYYYTFGSRAICQYGWNASLAYPNHFVTGGPDAVNSFNENARELSDMNEDYTECVDLAKTYPEMVAQMRTLFKQQARDHQFYPIITWDGVLNSQRHER